MSPNLVFNMPNAANIVIADALAIPVDHTFVPIGPDTKDSTKFWFEDQSQASPAGYWRLAVSLKRPPMAKAGADTANRTVRALIELHEPILEVAVTATYSGIAPAPRVSYVPRSFVEFVMPERSTLQNRKDLRTMTVGALIDGSIATVIEHLQAFN